MLTDPYAPGASPVTAAHSVPIDTIPSILPSTKDPQYLPGAQDLGTRRYLRSFPQPERAVYLAALGTRQLSRFHLQLTRQPRGVSYPSPFDFADKQRLPIVAFGDDIDFEWFAI